jgi:hypothetical protein
MMMMTLRMMMLLIELRYFEALFSNDKGVEGAALFSNSVMFWRGANSILAKLE